MFCFNGEDERLYVSIGAVLYIYQLVKLVISVGLIKGELLMRFKAHVSVLLRCPCVPDNDTSLAAGDGI